MTPLPPHIYLGLDLGQRHDPAAIALLARLHEIAPGFDPVTWEPHREFHLYLLHVERIPLATPYLRIVDRVADFLRSASLEHLASTLGPFAFGAPHRTLVVDASGVGAPVVELFRKARLTATLAPITITSGTAAHSDHATGGALVPRRDLLTALRILLEKRRLSIPTRLHDRAALLAEITRLTDQPTTQHDDLAIATALAAWQSTRGIHL
ncbi:MAG: hypothetical protein NTW28_38135 [Candidatus Solibacter sp.]|nr:hypothetical protein [Candidatus Solibacter sp.]